MASRQSLLPLGGVETASRQIRPCPIMNLEVSRFRTTSGFGFADFRKGVNLSAHATAYAFRCSRPDKVLFGTRGIVGVQCGCKLPPVAMQASSPDIISFTVAFCCADEIAWDGLVSASSLRDVTVYDLRNPFSLLSIPIHVTSLSRMVRVLAEYSS